MSEETRSSVEIAAIPSNRYGKLLAALKKVPVKEECNQSPDSDGERLQTPHINQNVKTVSAPFQSSPNMSMESFPTPDIPMGESPSDSSSASELEKKDPSPAVYEITWDHTMSDGSEEEEEEEEEEDFHSVDGDMYDKWYSGSSAADMRHDNWYRQTDQANCEFMQRFEDDDNSYEVDEVTIKFKELAHSDRSSCGPDYLLDKWSHNFEEDEGRNKIYDKWFCDVETWERQRLLWLDERGKIEGFDSSCDKDRTFLVKVDDAAPKLPSTTGTIKRHQSLIDSALFNVNEDYSFDQSKEDVLGVSECSNAHHAKQICEILSKDSSTNLVRYSEEPMESEISPMNLPHDLTSVYEFTDCNLWRKYHNCFKEGKFSNNQ